MLKIKLILLGDLSVEARDLHGAEISLDLNSSLFCGLQNLGFGKHRIEVKGNTVGRYKIYIYWSGAVVPTAYPLVAIIEQPGTTNLLPLSSTSTNKHATQTRNVSQRKETIETERRISGGEERVVKTKHYGSSGVLEIDNALGIQLHGKGLTEATLREQAEFTIEYTKNSTAQKSASQFSASLIGTKADIPVRISLQRSNIFKCNYTPLIPGNYELNVFYDGHLVGDSPYNVIFNKYFYY